jgi:integrase
MALSDVGIRNLKPRAADYKVADGGGLHLLVRPGGSRLWRLAYRFSGRQKTLSFGAYPVVGLAEARAARTEAKRLLSQGADPGASRKAQKASTRQAAEETFAAVSEDWLARIEADGRDWKTLRKQRYLLAQATPFLGPRPVREITSREVFEVLKRIEASGRLDTARAVRTTCSQVFRHAIVTARADQDPTVPLVGATRAPAVVHHAAIFEPGKLAALMAAIGGYDGDPSTRTALRLLPYVIVRSSELRLARWAEFDLSSRLWTIPGERMKGRKIDGRPHLVPLSAQAVQILGAHWQARLSDDLVFPGLRGGRPISDNTINAALRRLGYDKTEMTGHGFRRTASTILNEQGWNRDWIERQLAHVEKDKVRRAYNAAEYLEGRASMMQAWADWLDDLALLG